MPHVDVLNQQFIDYQLTLKKVVSTLVPQPDVDDIVQETYIRACLVNYEIKSPRSYLVKVARNLAVDHLKRAEYRLCDPLFDENGELKDDVFGCKEDSTLLVSVSHERYEALCDAINTLPQQCQKAFVMRKIYGYSQKEIAEEMNIGESSVEKHIAKGLKRCRKLMNNASGAASYSASIT